MDNIAIGDFDLLYSVFLTINLFKTTIKNSSQTNSKSLLQDMEHSVNDSLTIRLAIILKNNLINTLKLFQNYFTEVHFFLQYHAANNACSALYILVSSCSSQDN